LTYFNLNITKAVNNASVTLNITASGPESGIIYPSSGIWNINNISTDYPLLDYAEGGGGGSQLYLGTMKLCAPPTGTQQASPISPNEKWIPYNNWVKGLMFITVNFKNISA
jgi:hypothetical protein